MMVVVVVVVVVIRELDLSPPLGRWLSSTGQTLANQSTRQSADEDGDGDGDSQLPLNNTYAPLGCTLRTLCDAIVVFCNPVLMCVLVAQLMIVVVMVITMVAN